MRSCSLYAHSIAELQTKIDYPSPSDFQATLAIVFSSTTHDLETVMAVFRERDIDVLGSSTAGEICDDATFSAGIVVLLLEFNRDCYRIWSGIPDTETTYQMAHQLGQAACAAFDHPALLIVSAGITVDGEQVVFGIQDGAGQEVPLFGGMAGDDLELNHTFAFTNNCLTDSGFVALIIDEERVEVKGLATCGWKAVGKVNTITQAEGNILQRIDNEPALDVFLRYFGFFDNAGAKAEQSLLSTISGQYPLQIMREGGYSILRAPIIGNEEDRSLVMAGGVKEGDRFRFSISPGFEVIADTLRTFEDFRPQMPEADALVLFSCKGRHAALGPLIEEEVQGLHELWKSPMVGFFTYGEIGPSQTGTCEFHNETCSLVLFREKN